MKHVATLLLALSAALALDAQVASPPRFDVTEKSIAELQDAMTRKQVTSRELVTAYLARIAAYERRGPRINAFISLNPRALETAATLDAERAKGKVRGPLHGIPVVVKDNFETSDMPTTGSTIGLATYQPTRDAFQVARLREAGAVIIGKTNLQELAAGIVSVSSLGGQTRNPYDPTRNPGGSSGGTGAAIAASFAAAGLGSDTCGSIRIPASHNNLVGLRPTYGLSSRDGVIPLSHTQDVAGPLARSIKDLAVMLDATVGVDPADETTNAGRGRAPASYLAGLDAGALKGSRIGVLESLFGDAPEDAEVAAIVRAAVDRMKTAGASVVVVTVPNLTDLLRGTSMIDMEFKFDLADFLAGRPSARVRTLGEILDRGLYHENLESGFRRRNAVVRDENAHRTALARRQDVRKAVIAAMDAERVTALVYPTIRRAPALIGAAQAGTNCQLSPSTDLPALAIPAGFTPAGLPVGLELLGRPFSEPDLLRLGYAFEQIAALRRAPSTTPPLGTTPEPIAIGLSGAPAATGRGGAAVEPTLTASFTVDTTGAVLSYDARVAGVSPADVLVGTLHRVGESSSNGPVIDVLLQSQQIAGTGRIVLSQADRDALAAGRLYVQLFTRQHPLGTARHVVRVGGG